MNNFKEFRCFGRNKRDKICNNLLFKYKVLKDEVVIQIKCPYCNTFNILHLAFKKAKKHENSKEQLS